MTQQPDAVEVEDRRPEPHGESGPESPLADSAPAAEPDSELDDGFEELLEFVREARGTDFTGYKRASLRRRVRRRMDQIGSGTFPEYLDRLQVEPEEFGLLFTTILINVTSFFRDPDMWARLSEDVLPDLLAKRSDDDLIRVWCAGCSSGEEAYTVAIVLAELLGADVVRDRVKIYATDVDEDALTHARAAVYTDRELRAVPAELLTRYFDVVGEERRAFRKDLRRSVIFGRNDLVKDAPISRIDILTCRNTLMYFTPETQAGVLNRFRFAMAPDGVLVLGKAEMLLSHSRMFEPIDLKRRIFHKIGSPVAGATTISPDFVQDRRPAMGSVDRVREHAFDAGPVPQLVLSEQDVLALANQQADEVLGVGARDVGRPLRDLEISYRPVELRSVVERVRIERRPTRITDVVLHRDEAEPLIFEVHVTPLIAGNSSLLGVSVVFHDVTAAHRLLIDLDRANGALEAAYEELQSTSEELETTNEELQSTVEELETTNEELQSTNEELETMNEELRSANDELQRSNDDAREHSGALDHANDFLESILASLRSAVVVVDDQMRITVWNSGAEELWGLRREEVRGEHLLNLDIGFPLEIIRADVRSALSDGKPGSERTASAVNRRGRTVTVQVTTSPLLSGGTISGAAVVMVTTDGSVDGEVPG